MKTFLIYLALIFTLTSCANTPEEETGEIKTLQLLKQVFDGKKHSKIFVDARTLLSREKIDAVNIPILFVEMESGQNGTLLLYPGQGIGQTWLGADGATITLDGGILKASRGMGDDLMGSSINVPQWSKIDDTTKPYPRKLSYITGNNKILNLSFECKIKKNNHQELIKVWGIEYSVTEFEENCISDKINLENRYHVDKQGIVRKSLQYHSEKVGYLLTERIDR